MCFLLSQVICEKADRSDIPDIDKKKYLVPADLSTGEREVGLGGEAMVGAYVVGNWGHQNFRFLVVVEISFSRTRMPRTAYHRPPATVIAAVGCLRLCAQAGFVLPQHITQRTTRPLMTFFTHDQFQRDVYMLPLSSLVD